MSGPPTHRLVITDKENRHRRTRAGVAWINEKGWISIALNPGVAINYNDSKDCFISLYPIDQKGESHYETSSHDKFEADVEAEFGDDDLPF